MSSTSQGPRSKPAQRKNTSHVSPPCLLCRMLSQGFLLLMRCDTTTKRQLGKERVYLASTSMLLFIIKRSQDRNSNRAGSWRQ